MRKLIAGVLLATALLSCEKEVTKDLQSEVTSETTIVKNVKVVYKTTTVNTTETNGILDESGLTKEMKEILAKGASFWGDEEIHLFDSVAELDAHAAADIPEGVEPQVVEKASYRWAHGMRLESGGSVVRNNDGSLHIVGNRGYRSGSSYVRFAVAGGAVRQSVVGSIVVPYVGNAVNNRFVQAIVKCGRFRRGPVDQSRLVSLRLYDGSLSGHQILYHTRTQNLRVINLPNNYVSGYKTLMY